MISSDVIRGINGDISGLYFFLDALFNFVSELLTAVMISVFIIATDPLMASGILVLLFGCMILVTFGFKKKLSKYGKEFREAQAQQTKTSYQAIMGIKEIKVMHREEHFVQKYKEASGLSVVPQISNAFAGALPERVIEGICISGIIAVVCIRIMSGTDVTKLVPKLGAFAVAAFRILPSMSRMTGYINGMVYQRPALEATYINMYEVNNYEKYCEEEVKKRKYVTEEVSSCKASVKNWKEIVLKDITWKYENAPSCVLRELKLNIIKGQAIALIGESGAGKTTLADIIMGLLIPDSGKVLIENIDIFTIPEQWCNLIGYVPQNIFLIDDTIRNNVAFGLEGEEVSEAKVWTALEQAQLKTFVEQLPEKLDTIIGERGIKFSGGQRQRIAIARALYNNPDILVLDEATSALDNETETAVMEAINALHGYKTLIIVAHRLTTIRNCDIIYEITDGEAIQRDKEKILAL